MNIDNSFSSRVAMARSAVGLTQSELSERSGVVRRQIAAYEAGTSKPRPSVLHNLAAALGTTSEWLASGVGNGPDVRNVRKTITVPLIPVYTSVQASYATEGISESSASDFIPCPEGAGENSYAILIQGDSMTCNGPVSFPQGTIVTIDPEALIDSGDFGLFSTEYGETTFKQYIIDQGRSYLKPLNPNYPMFEAPPETEILGKAVHAQRDLKLPPAGGAPNHADSDLSSRLERMENLMKLLLKGKQIAVDAINKENLENDSSE